ELQRERLRVVPLFALQHLDLDDRRRADVLAQAAADAVLLARLLVVGQREQAAIAARVLAGLVRVMDGDRLAEQVLERRAHRAQHGAGNREDARAVRLRAG